MTTQTTLFKPRAPKVTPADLENLKMILEHLGTVKALAIAYLAQTTLFERWSDRKIRAIASASKGQIIGTDDGYCLTKNVTHEVYCKWKRRNLNQCAETKRRVIESDKVFYGRS